MIATPARALALSYDERVDHDAERKPRADTRTGKSGSAERETRSSEYQRRRRHHHAGFSGDAYYLPPVEWLAVLSSRIR